MNRKPMKAAKTEKETAAEDRAEKGKEEPGDVNSRMNAFLRKRVKSSQR